MSKKKYKLIAFDLDGTILNSEKEITERTMRALCKASEAGIEIVPSTGRLLRGVPEIIRELPFVRYAITINGAAVMDVKSKTNIYEDEMSLKTALELIDYLKNEPVAYDCYQGNNGWMNAEMYDGLEDYLPHTATRAMVRANRRPIADLRSFLLESNRSVQKVQAFARSESQRDELLNRLKKQFPNLEVAFALDYNVEITNASANKGRALNRLASHLGLDITQTVAFGDGLNDISMLAEAGLGIAMENATPEAKKAANLIAPSNNADGVACVIEYLLEEIDTL